MDTEAGEGLREAFLAHLEVMGAEYDVGGEQRIAGKNAEMKKGFVVLRFADEFSVKKGDRIREARSELQFDVVEVESNTNQGILTSFDVTALRV